MADESCRNETVFAKILRGEIPSVRVYEDEGALAFMDIMPQSKGHIVLIPKRPSRDLLDAAPETLARLIVLAQKLARAAKAALKADGITLMQCNEAAGGQSVFHLHFHIIPRFDGAALKPHQGAAAATEELERQAEKIRAALKAQNEA